MITAISIEDLAIVRGERRLFAHLSFRLEAGTAAALVGANGAGKTSLLRAVAGLIRLAHGEVRFEGGAPKTGAAAELEAETARARGLHLLAHHDGLKSTRTAGEELAFWARWSGGTAETLQAAVERLALKPLMDLDIRKLSAGQRRRVALARLIAAPRPVWLLDEPMAPLDSERRALLGTLMAEHLAGGGLLLCAVHDPLPVPAQEIRIGASLTGFGL